MVKEKKILLYFIAFILGLLTTMLIGISDVFALTYNNIGYVSEQTDMMVEVSYESETGAPVPIEWGQNYYVQFDIMYINVFNYQFNANVHYQLEMYFPDMQITNGNYYEVYDQDNNTQCEISYTYSSFGSEYPRWDFQCPNATRSIMIKIANNQNTAITEMGNFYWAYAYLRYTDADIDSTGSEIADNVINNNNANTDKVIENNNQNTDKIIESNKETQEVIKDQFNSCHDSYNLFDFNNFKNLSSEIFNVNVLDDNSISMKRISDTTFNYSLNLKENTQYTISLNFKNSNSVNYYILFSYTDGTTSTIVPSKYYPEFTHIIATSTSGKTIQNISVQMYGYANQLIFLDNIMLNEGNTSLDYEPYGEKICTNKLDEQNETLQGIQGALTDSSTPNLDSLEDSIGWLPPGPVDSILNLPLTMLNSLTNSLNKTCSPLNLTLPYVNSQIQIPCLSAIFEQITGVNGLWTWVGTIASVLILYNYLLNLYAWVDKVLTLRAEFDEAMGADLANWGRL